MIQLQNQSQIHLRKSINSLNYLFLPPGLIFFAVPQRTMMDWIQRVVEIESPVHINEVVKRIANAAGFKKVGNRIQGAVKSAATQATRSKSIQIKETSLYETFLYWTGQKNGISRFGIS